MSHRQQICSQLPQAPRALLVLAASALTVLVTHGACAEEPTLDHFYEKGRVGVMGAITEDQWKGGLVFEHEVFEAQLLFHAAFEEQDTRDMHTMLKLGGRVNLGTRNYFAVGAEFGTFKGAKERGVDIGNAYQVGPYVSLERYFGTSPVMLNLWVNPVLYDHALEVEADGQLASVNTIRVLQAGGFGLAYLF